VLAHRYRASTQAWLARAGALAVLLPWAAFMLYASWPIVAQSVRQLEGFPESYSPGYFLVKVALFVLALLVLLQALVDVARRPPAELR